MYDDQSAIEICEIVRKQFINRDAVILSKQLSILIRYPSKSVAIEGYQLLAEILYGYAGLKKIDLVAISEHCVLECQWRSQNNLLSTVERLHRAEQSLRGTKLCANFAFKKMSDTRKDHALLIANYLSYI